MSRRLHGLSIQKSAKTLEALGKIFAFVAGLFLFVSAAAAATSETNPTYDKMTVQQKVGQVFIWTYYGTELSPLMQRWLEKYQPGALIVFKRNIKSTRQIALVNQKLQALAAQKMSAPLFLMIDQEGGLVTRLRTSVPLPSALALGKMNDSEFIETFAQASAEVLHDVGFNVDLAPVLDISNPNRDSFIGNRAFGENPETVAELAIAYAQGINAGGLIPTAKHYPGHGGITQDSHRTTPQKLATYEELADKDLVPFEEYAQSEFPRAMMMAHLSLPAIDTSGVPTTYSKILIQSYLREKLKYDGLVITDDLEMSGASIDADIGERAVRAFIAGNDMLMLAGSPAHQKKAFEALLTAVKSGSISEERLKQSVLRILNYKKAMKIGPFNFDDKRTTTAIAHLDGLSKEVHKKNFQLSVAGKTASWPKLDPKSEVLVMSADQQFYTGFQAAYHGKSKYFHLTPQSLERVAGELGQERYSLAIYFASGNQTAHWLEKLPAALRSKLIVVNANHAGDVEDQKTFLSVLNINSYDPAAGFALGETLETPPDQRAPAAKLEIPKTDEED